jgi:hypothetical protein
VLLQVEMQLSSHQCVVDIAALGNKLKSISVFLVFDAEESLEGPEHTLEILVVFEVGLLHGLLEECSSFI